MWPQGRTKHCVYTGERPRAACALYDNRALIVVGFPFTARQWLFIAPGDSQQLNTWRS